MEELQEGINTGLIESAPIETDFILGAETGIAPEVRLTSGNWKEYLPTDETQKKRFDTMACVTFSALNSIEAQLNLLMALGLIPKTILDELKSMGYIDENGRFNFSDRFTAKMSGTTKSGNYMVAVWDSIRNHGILPEKDWKFELDFDWDEYYEEIPQHLKDKAKRFNELFEVRYEWVATKAKPATREGFAEVLKLAPIHLGTAVCRPWNDGPVPRCSLSISHCTLAYDVDSLYQILDHYSPYKKSLAADYYIPYGIRGVIYLRQQSPTAPFPTTPPVIQPPVVFKHRFVPSIKFGQRSSEVVALQDALRLDGVFPKTVMSTGYYGDITRKAVLAFQRKYKVANPVEITYLNGRLVGPQTVAKLNELFNK